MLALEKKALCDFIEHPVCALKLKATCTQLAPRRRLGARADRRPGLHLQGAPVWEFELAGFLSGSFGFRARDIGRSLAPTPLPER